MNSTWHGIGRPRRRRQGVIAETMAADLPKTMLDSADLVARARRGEAQAREELAQRIRLPAYRLALQLLGDSDDAMDVAQDAMLRFFTHIDRFDIRRPVLPWVFSIVHNRVRDFQRRRRRRPGDYAGDPVDVSEVPLAAPGVDPEQALGRRELQRRIWKGLAALSTDHRRVLVLRDYQDLSYDEIATVLEVPRGTVMSRLHRARRALARHLGPSRIAGRVSSTGDAS